MTDVPVVEGMHGNECPDCGGLVGHYGDRASSGGSCHDCDYSYIDAEPDDEDTVTYDELMDS